MVNRQHSLKYQSLTLPSSLTFLEVGTWALMESSGTEVLGQAGSKKVQEDSFYTTQLLLEENFNTSWFNRLPFFNEETKSWKEWLWEGLDQPTAWVSFHYAHRTSITKKFTWPEAVIPNLQRLLGPNCVPTGYQVWSQPKSLSCEQWEPLEILEQGGGLQALTLDLDLDLTLGLVSNFLSIISSIKERNLSP